MKLSGYGAGSKTYVYACLTEPICEELVNIRDRFYIVSSE